MQRSAHFGGASSSSSSSSQATVRFAGHGDASSNGQSMHNQMLNGMAPNVQWNHQYIAQQLVNRGYVLPPSMQPADQQLFHAVLVQFDPSIAGDPSVVMLGMQYCEALQRSDDGWRVALQKLQQYPDAPYQFIFWCIQMVGYAVTVRYKSLSSDEQNAIRSTLMGFAAGDQVLHHAVKGKVADALMAVLQHDYPKPWGSFFHDFIGILGNGPQTVDIFLRILTRIDEDIVSFDDRRTDSEVLRNTQIKEAMKSDAMDDIVGTLHSVISTYSSSDPQLTAQALHTLEEYIGWINVNLVVNDKFVPLFYSLTDDPRYRVGAVKCLVSIVDKTMSPPEKLAVMKHIKIVDFVMSVPFCNDDNYVLGGNSSDDALNNVEYMAAVASLIATLGLQVIQFVTDQLEPVADLSVLEVMLPRAFEFLAHNNHLVGSKITKLLLDYLSLLRSVQRGRSSRVCSAAADLLSNLLSSGAFEQQGQAIFAIIMHKVQLPNGYNFDEQSHGDAEESFDKFRRELDTIFKHYVGLCTDQAVELVLNATMGVLENPLQQPFAQLEAVLHLFYVLPEGGRSSIAKHSNMFCVPPFSTVLKTLFSSTVSQYNHTHIKLLYFELISRYSAVLASDTDLLPGVISTFLDKRGIRHPDHLVRDKAARCLFRLADGLPVKVKQKLVPVLDQLFGSIHEAIQPVLRRGQLNTQPVDRHQLLSYASSVQLSQVMGILACSRVVRDEQECVRHITSILHSFHEPLLAGLEQKEALVRSDPELAGKRFSQMVDALVSALKHLGNDVLRVAAPLEQVATTVIQVLQLLPNHDEVRSKTIAFLHILVGVLKAQADPVVQVAMVPLLKGSHKGNLSELLNLVNRCIIELGAHSFDTINGIFTPLVHKVLEALESLSEVRSLDDKVAEARAHAEDRFLFSALRKSFTTVLRNLADPSTSSPYSRGPVQPEVKEQLDHAGVLTAVFTSHENRDRLQLVLGYLFDACVDTDLKLARTAFYAVPSFIKSWATQPSLHSVAFDGATRDQLLPELIKKPFEAVLKSGVDVNGDPDSSTLAVEICEYQHTLSACLGPDYQNGVGAFLMGQLGFTEEQAQQYVGLLAAGDMRAFHEFFKGAVVALQKSMSQS